MNPVSLHQGDRGMSLVELLIAIVIIGIAVSVAMTALDINLDDSRCTRTEQEMDMLLAAIAGDPNRMEGGIRSDFGYVGDVGSFPSDLLALSVNPGLATWDGPYISSHWDENPGGFLRDEWGKQYVYAGGTTIVSTGGDNPVTKSLPGTLSSYLVNEVRGTIVDAGGAPPGLLYTDSVVLEINYPRGQGAVATTVTHPDPAGHFTLDSLPVGRHKLTIVFEPKNDTLLRFLTVLPSHRSSSVVTYAFGSPHFQAAPAYSASSGGLIPETESARP